jgi:hypothetical protein
VQLLLAGVAATVSRVKVKLLCRLPRLLLVLLLLCWELLRPLGQQLRQLLLQVLRMCCCCLAAACGKDQGRG